MQTKSAVTFRSESDDAALADAQARGLVAQTAGIDADAAAARVEASEDSATLHAQSTGSFVDPRDSVTYEAGAKGYRSLAANEANRSAAEADQSKAERVLAEGVRSDVEGSVAVAAGHALTAQDAAAQAAGTLATFLATNPTVGGPYADTAAFLAASAPGDRGLVLAADESQYDLYEHNVLGNADRIAGAGILAEAVVDAPSFGRDIAVITSRGRVRDGSPTYGAPVMGYGPDTDLAAAQQNFLIVQDMAARNMELILDDGDVILLSEGIELHHGTRILGRGSPRCVFGLSRAILDDTLKDFLRSNLLRPFDALFDATIGVPYADIESGAWDWQQVPFLTGIVLEGVTFRGATEGPAFQSHLTNYAQWVLDGRPNDDREVRRRGMGFRDQHSWGLRMTDTAWVEHAQDGFYAGAHTNVSANASTAIFQRITQIGKSYSAQVEAMYAAQCNRNGVTLKDSHDSVFDGLHTYRNCVGRAYETDAANYVRFTAGDLDLEPDSDAGTVTNVTLKNTWIEDPGYNGIQVANKGEGPMRGVSFSGLKVTLSDEQKARYAGDSVDVAVKGGYVIDGVRMNPPPGMEDLLIEDFGFEGFAKPLVIQGGANIDSPFYEGVTLRRGTIQKPGTEEAVVMGKVNGLLIEDVEVYTDGGIALRLAAVTGRVVNVGGAGFAFLMTQGGIYPEAFPNDVTLSGAPRTAPSASANHPRVFGPEAPDSVATEVYGRTDGAGNLALNIPLPYALDPGLMSMGVLDVMIDGGSYAQVESFLFGLKNNGGTLRVVLRRRDGTTWGGVNTYALTVTSNALVAVGDGHELQVVIDGAFNTLRSAVGVVRWHRPRTITGVAQPADNVTTWRS